MKPPIIQITPPTDGKAKIHQEEFEIVPDDDGNCRGLTVNPSKNRKNGLYKDLVLDTQHRWALPQQFHVRYIGKCPTDGLWGIAHTQKQVESIIGAARKANRRSANVLIHVSEDGVKLSYAPKSSVRDPDFSPGFYPIQNISYGVQDMIYTRVFAMICINDSDDTEEKSPFECVAFACDRTDIVHELTRSLAESFKRFATDQDQMTNRRPSVMLKNDSVSEHSDA